MPVGTEVPHCAQMVPCAPPPGVAPICGADAVDLKLAKPARGTPGTTISASFRRMIPPARAMIAATSPMKAPYPHEMPTFGSPDEGLTKKASRVRRNCNPRATVSSCQ